MGFSWTLNTVHIILKKRGERGGHAGSSDRELAAALTVKPVLTRALTGWQGGRLAGTMLPASLPPFCGGRGGQREAQAAADLCALGDVHSRHRMCDRKWKTNRHMLIFLPLVHLQNLVILLGLFSKMQNQTTVKGKGCTGFIITTNKKGERKPRFYYGWEPKS